MGLMRPFLMRIRLFDCLKSFIKYNKCVGCFYRYVLQLIMFSIRGDINSKKLSKVLSYALHSFIGFQIFD